MKNTYSTGLIIKYKLGLLSHDVTQFIPSSTLWNWKNNRNLSNIIGIDKFEENEDNIQLLELIYQNERFLKMVTLLAKVLVIMQSIINSLENKNYRLYQSKQLIINIITEYKHHFGITKICKLFCISSKRYYTWKNMVENCVHPVKEICKRTSPAQLSFKEQNIIKSYLQNTEFVNWGISNIYYQLIEDSNAFMSLTSFRNYARKFMPNRILPKNIKTIKKIGVRSSKPFEKLHMDVTIYRPLDNTRVYIYFIVD